MGTFVYKLSKGVGYSLKANLEQDYSTMGEVMGALVFFNKGANLTPPCANTTLDLGYRFLREYWRRPIRTLLTYFELTF